MGWLRKRGNEPSTHAGIAAMSQGLKLLAPHWGFAFDILTMAFGALAAVKSDQASK